MTAGDDAGRRRQAAEVFDLVVDAPDGERMRLLDEACGQDLDLRGQVEALLRADRDAAGFLAEPHDVFGAAGAGATSTVADDRTGEQVGPYRILRLVGRGGMGDVFLAERADGQFDQQVALKVVRREFAAPAVVRRFLRERQILARLRHPNIAQLLDGGVSADGEPYFVMEFVDGRPITVAAEDAPGLEARLGLWLDACAAVQYAHRSLVVHRDIKPSNVLVTAEGQVRLVDFGIATVLDPVAEGNEGSTTLFGARLLTPAYAAPEQVRGEAVTTATDVYALGALLYELLCGQRAVDTTGTTPAEVERAICERDPVAPSRRAAPPLAKRLRGDLDTIVLTALAKAPQHRYASVEALADDVRRHLAHKPIRARPQGAWYRGGRFVRRHRVGVVAAAAVLLAVLAGSGVALWQARRATAEARRATAVQDFLLGLYELADPETARRSDVSARELLDRGVSRLDTTLADDAALRAELLTLSGTIYRKLGSFDASIRAIERAVEAASGPGVDPAARPAALEALGSALKEVGQPERAERVLREAVAARESLVGRDHPDTARAMSELANVLSRRGAKDEAERLHREVLAIDVRAHGRDHVAVASDLDNLGVFLLDAGKYDDADRALAEALAIARRAGDSGDPLVATVLGNLAVLRSMQERTDESLAYQREVLAVRRRIYGDTHPDVALSLSNIAATLVNAGRLDEGQAAHQEALDIRMRVLGPSHPDTVVSLNGLAVVAYRRGDLQAAIGAMREAVAAWRAAPGEHSPAHLMGMNNLGVMLNDAGEVVEAERLLREALEQRQRVLGAENTETAHSMRNLAVLLHRTGRDAEAEPLARTALGLQARHLAGDHPRRLDAMATLGAILLARGRHAEAEPLLHAAETGRRQRFGEDHPDTLETRGLLGACLLARGDSSGDAMLASSHEALAARPGQQARTAELARYLRARPAGRAGG